MITREPRIAEALEDGIAASGVYRLLFRALISDPQEVRSFYDDTVEPVVRYDTQYRSDLLDTLEEYLASDCNMNATARAIYAHRHTVAYRLDRVRELTGLDPAATEDRERLGLGIKAYRILAPALPALSALQPGVVAHRVPARVRVGRVPARALAACVARRVEAQAGDHDVGVAGVRVDRQPLAAARLAPAHQLARGGGGAEQAGAGERVADRAGAVVAVVAERAVAAAPLVGEGG